MSKWGELVDGAITRPTWGELVGRVDSYRADPVYPTATTDGG